MPYLDITLSLKARNVPVLDRKQLMDDLRR